MHIKEDMLSKAIVYKVTINQGQKENQFHITWYNPGNGSQDGFITETNITPEETQRLLLLQGCWWKNIKSRLSWAGDVR